MKVGLVLEGGAMRGMYTAGVLDIFLDKQIQVDGIVGVSAGALFGVNYLSKQRGRVIRYNKRFNGDKNYFGLRPFLHEGNIINTKYAFHDVPYILDPFDDETYQNSGIPFYAVVTNIKNGQPEYILIKSAFEQMDTLRASGAMPFVSKPVKIGEEEYLDGGISDSIPFEWLSGQGYDKLIVILTRQMGYRKKPMSKPLIQLGYHKYPKLASKLMHRHQVYNQAIEKLSEREQQGKAFVIRPSKPIEIARMEKNPEKLQSVYDMGVQDAVDCLEDLRTYIH